MTYSPDVQTTTVITTILTNVFGGAVLYYIFERYRGIREIYLARMRNPQNSTPGELDQGFGSWISSIGKISDQDTLGYIGKIVLSLPWTDNHPFFRIGCLYFLAIPSFLYPY
jgi:hypothetical protein